jgi:hypothetical protein
MPLCTCDSSINAPAPPTTPPRRGHVAGRDRVGAAVGAFSAKRQRLDQHAVRGAQSSDTRPLEPLGAAAQPRLERLQRSERRTVEPPDGFELRLRLDQAEQLLPTDAGSRGRAPAAAPTGRAAAAAGGVAEAGLDRGAQRLDDLGPALPELGVLALEAVHRLSRRRDARPRGLARRALRELLRQLRVSSVDFEVGADAGFERGAHRRQLGAPRPAPVLVHHRQRALQQRDAIGGVRRHAGEPQHLIELLALRRHAEHRLERHGRRRRHERQVEVGGAAAARRLAIDSSMSETISRTSSWR